MRQLMDLFKQDDPFDFVTTDDRYKEVAEAMVALRGYNPHEKMTRAEFNQMKDMSRQFSEGLAGLENDYDVPADVIRVHIIRSLKSRDN